MIDLHKSAPCECGRQAKLTFVKTKRLVLDGQQITVRGFPQYKCKGCKSTWVPLVALKLVRYAVVSRIIAQRALTPHRLLFVRKTMGLSQAQFAEALGLKGGKSLISKYEAGQQSPQHVTVQAIGLFAEKWFHERWQLEPREPFGFDLFQYGDQTRSLRPVDFSAPGFVPRTTDAALFADVAS